MLPDWVQFDQPQTPTRVPSYNRPPPLPPPPPEAPRKTAGPQRRRIHDNDNDSNFRRRLFCDDDDENGDNNAATVSNRNRSPERSPVRSMTYGALHHRHHQTSVEMVSPDHDENSAMACNNDENDDHCNSLVSCVRQIHETNDNVADQALERLRRSLLRPPKNTHNLQAQNSTILLQLLSLGTSSSSSTPSCRRSKRVLEATRLLLQVDWGGTSLLIQTVSPRTGCTALHMALKHFPTHLELTQLLLLQNSEQQRIFLLTHTNYYGDLALHVASMAGASVPVLTYLLEQTVQTLLSPYSNPATLLWQRNGNVHNAGYTMLELEWMAFVEHGASGGGSSISSSSNSSRQHWNLSWTSPRDMHPDHLPRTKRSRRRQKESMFLALLQESLLLLISEPNKSQDETPTLNASLRGFWSRMQLILRCSTRTQLPVEACDGDHDTAWDLHRVCMITSPQGPTIPEPITAQMVRMYTNNAKAGRVCVDSTGSLPLHHLLQNAAAVPSPPVVKRWCESCCRSPPRGGNPWTAAPPCTAFLKLAAALVECHPDACKIRDRSGRYPLHHVVTLSLIAHDDDENEIATIDTNDFSKLIQSICQTHTAASMVRDPVTHLLPWQASATNPSVPLNVTYWLLRRNPNLI